MSKIRFRCRLKSPTFKGTLAIKPELQCNVAMGEKLLQLSLSHELFMYRFIHLLVYLHFNLFTSFNLMSLNVIKVDPLYGCLFLCYF